MDAILRYLFANLNGATETAVLFILVFFDTFLGSLWRKRNNVARTSGGGLGGLITSIPLALMPVVIWGFTILISIVPTHLGGRDFLFDPLIFDVISFMITIMIGSYMLKSIYANMQLAGIEIPDFLAKWVEDEYHVKVQKIQDEPEAANITEIGKEK
ncbi:phage holin family protein [Leuconostoc mesenteroides]|uniref:phage holin family protein n=1 Tax=Leuconostoc mesenteroides TaxID=1245 RepID=UPI0021D2C87E|nr:phage holin family protein [Leuconostoc mesenteroides]MCU4664300.1 phage holin family protein [Leuconostoc mesenteroides]